MQHMHQKHHLFDWWTSPSKRICVDSMAGGVFCNQFGSAEGPQCKISRYRWIPKERPVFKESTGRVGAQDTSPEEIGSQAHMHVCLQ
jgi:hypothetical protein